MHKALKTEREVPLTLRVGAAAIYIFVGLVLGVVVAFTMFALKPGTATPSFATIVFGVTAVSATIAASFPTTALASLAPLASFVWGFMNGYLIPESMTRPEREIGRMGILLFWSGVALGCLLLLAWLLWRVVPSAA